MEQLLGCEWSSESDCNKVGISEFFLCPVTKQNGNNDLYSQFFEDYILSIVFKDKNNGLYIDVGANSPNELSVTKHFYLKGWRGINIDPVKQNYDLFIQYRPQDINYNIGIADKAGELDFYENSYNAISGFSLEDMSLAAKNLKKYKVEVRTLTEILDENNMNEIDLLNIDVEGFERQVLLGMDFTKYQPKVILLESISPKTLEPVHEKWEDILIQAGYRFILFDGLNRHYLSKRHLNLVENYKKAYECVVSNLGEDLRIHHMNPPVSFNFTMLSNLL